MNIVSLINKCDLRKKQIIIATGCETIVPPMKGLKETGFIANVQAVALPTLPHRMAIIGGGNAALPNSIRGGISGSQQA